MANKESELKSIMHRLRIVHAPIVDAKTLSNIHDLFVANILFEPTNDVESQYIGLYYLNIKQDYANAKKHYLNAIAQGNTNALNDLAYYYDVVEKDYKTAKKYYLRAINYGNMLAMYNLACYYEDIKHDVLVAEKYYLMAIELGHIKSMHHLADLYVRSQKDYTAAEKYYLMAIELTDTEAMYKLAYMYEIVDKNVSAEFYYLMALDNDNKNAMKLLENFYRKHDKLIVLAETYIKYPKLIDRNIMIELMVELWNIKLEPEHNKTFLELISSIDILPIDNVPTSFSMFVRMMRHENDIMRLHFDYTIKGKGYDDARRDFIDRIAAPITLSNNKND